METEATPGVGTKAPEFTLTATGGRTVRLKDFIGRKNLVLYFYPKDDTPGCTVEAIGFRDAYGDFEALDTVVLGVSRDSPERHQKFSGKCRLPFLLLSDPEADVARAYGAFGTKSFMGREFLGIHRTTFVIDRRGVIRQVWPRVKVKEHAAEVLGFVRTAFA
jgi:peroxiredoxin Q/BCP